MHLLPRRLGSRSLLEAACTVRFSPHRHPAHHRSRLPPALHRGCGRIVTLSTYAFILSFFVKIIANGFGSTAVAGHQRQGQVFIGAGGGICLSGSAVWRRARWMAPLMGTGSPHRKGGKGPFLCVPGCWSLGRCHSSPFPHAQLWASRASGMGRSRRGAREGRGERDGE